MRGGLVGVDRGVVGKGAGQAELPRRRWGMPLSLVEGAAVLGVLVAGRNYGSVCVCVWRGGVCMCGEGECVCVGRGSVCVCGEGECVCVGVGVCGWGEGGKCLIICTL